MRWLSMAITCGLFVLVGNLNCSQTGSTIAAENDAVVPPQPYGIDRRISWTNSRVVGSPDPPLPYVAVKAFPNLSLELPLYVKQEPASDRLIVVQQGGGPGIPSKLLRFEDRADVAQADLLLEIPDRIVYSLEFDPDYEQNGYFYVFTNGPTGKPGRQNRISRFRVARPAPATAAGACAPESELVLLQWRSEGHDGGDLVFGHDQMLYISSGDGTSDSDEWMSAQDISSLPGGVLRIDVRGATQERPYRIPDDNPFLDVVDARGEFWAIGLRNPWRMSMDRRTGQIWVGSNGQDLWESVNLLGRGENYGWSVYEGSHPFYPNRELGPGKLTMPTLEHHHIESRSLTGGVVYYGQSLADLAGAYVYGDYSTGKIWAARHDGQRVTWHQEIADTTLEIAGFSNSHRGELLIVDRSGGGIYRLKAIPPSDDRLLQQNFPLRLSETGLFASVAEHRPAPGVIGYSVVAPGWHDGAEAQRYLAIPGDGKVEVTANRGWNFPEGSVLLQTLTLDVVESGNATRRRIETRMLTKQQDEWAAYTYHWNEAQDDAVLVDASGSGVQLPIIQNGQVEHRSWRIPARSECMSCHGRAVNFVLGLSNLQMDREHDYGLVRDNQLRTLAHVGLISSRPDAPVDNQLVNPYDTNAAIESRARSYLHSNCAGCHVNNGGGNSLLEFEAQTPLDKMFAVSQYPQHATFGIANALIIAPGEPERSILLARIARRGAGQMPPVFTTCVDTQAVELMRQWIAGMSPEHKFVREWTAPEIIPHLSQLGSERSVARGREIFMTAGCSQCHRIDDEFSGIGPNLTDVARRLRPEALVEAIVAPSAVIAEQYAATRIATLDGEILQGQVELETDELLVLRGSQALAPRRTISKADIETRALSTVSPMPGGTVNHLELPEILDLLAYLIEDRTAPRDSSD